MNGWIWFAVFVLAAATAFGPIAWGTVAAIGAMVALITIAAWNGLLLWVALAFAALAIWGFIAKPERPKAPCS